MDLGSACRATVSLESVMEDGGGGSTCARAEITVAPITDAVRAALAADGQLPEFAPLVMRARLSAAADAPDATLASVSEGLPLCWSGRWHAPGGVGSLRLWPGLPSACYLKTSPAELREPC